LRIVRHGKPLSRNPQSSTYILLCAVFLEGTRHDQILFTWTGGATAPVSHPLPRLPDHATMSPVVHLEMIGKTLSHYQVKEQIGAGGMGVVYLAHDQKLERDVALKVLPAGLLADESARKRFRKEALALAKLNHPNISTVHDFATDDGTDFLVIEFIPGVTLLDKLNHTSLPMKDVIRLGIQLAQGLSAAHEQGIVHRDLKPANLRLTPDGRLKILDFGLAQLICQSGDHGLTATLTHSQEVTGTLPYMSPEQLRGEPADIRSDIWAAGAVLYEMATARRPFPEANSAMLINAILNHDPEPPSKVNRLVSPGLENVILKCLDKDPTRRYQNVRELGVDLERLTSGASALVQPRQKTRRWILPVAAVAVLALASSGYYFFHRTDAKAPAVQTAVKPRRSIAVLGFKNLAGRPELDWFSTALAEMLTTELSAGDELRTVPGESVARMKINLALPETDSYSKETLSKIRQILGTDEVILGSYLPIGEGLLRLDVRLQDAIAGETLASVSAKGSQEHLDQLVGEAGTEIRAKLGVGQTTASQSISLKMILPSNPQAARRYSEGLVRLRKFDSLGARQAFEQSIAIEPNFALSHRSLAAAWDSLGYGEKSKIEAKKAFDLSAGLPREERLSIEARYQVANFNWEKAAELYRSLFNFFPDDLDYGLQLVAAQSSAGNGKDALATVDVLRQLPSPVREDPSIDMAEATAARGLGDYRRVNDAAARAAAKAQVQGSQLLLAYALSYRCLAFRNLGEPAKAIAACEESRQIYHSVGDKGQESALDTCRMIGNQSCVAGALDNIAGVLGDLGNRAEAQKLTLDALKIFREIGDSTGEGEALNNIGGQYVVAGNYSAAADFFEQSLKIWRKKNDVSNIAISLHNLGEIRLALGQLPEAHANYQEAFTIARDSGQAGKSAYPLFGLGQVLLAEGDLAGSRERFEQVLALSNSAADKHQQATAILGLGQILLRQGDLAAARQKAEQCLAIRREIGEKATAAESMLMLAQIAMEERRFSDAEASTRQATDEFRAEKIQEDELQARALLARALQAQGKNGEARKQLEAASAIASRSLVPESRLNYTIAAALVHGAAGASAEASKSLEAAIAEASKLGYIGYQFDARLALGQLELKSGNAAAGRARLASLENEARAKGYLLIARQAAGA
jgi:serine/threonine protein kinase/tetratricopeptide (TPR) repeat protein